jgi:hypothetical protein
LYARFDLQHPTATISKVRKKETSLPRLESSYQNGDPLMTQSQVEVSQIGSLTFVETRSISIESTLVDTVLVGDLREREFLFCVGKRAEMRDYRSVE